MTTPRKEISKSAGSGCIEDRTFAGADQGELNQVPGADLFFSVARDAINTNGDVDHTLRDSVLADISALDHKSYTYQVHNDADHGGEFDGCGFAAQIKDIFIDASTNIEPILEELELNETDAKTARELAGTLGKLATHSSYLSVVGGELVEAAVNAGASLITYSGEHTASKLSIDMQTGRTYDSADANNPDTETEVTFNVDTNHAANRAQVFGVDSEKAKILAEVLSLATVRVLSNGAITKPDYV